MAATTSSTTTPMKAVDRASWAGTVDECADALTILLVNGPLEYKAKHSEQAKGEFMHEHLAGLHKLFRIIPKGNAKYSTFVKAILKMMAEGKYGTRAAHIHYQQSDGE